MPTCEAVVPVIGMAGSAPVHDVARRGPVALLCAIRVRSEVVSKELRPDAARSRKANDGVRRHKLGAVDNVCTAARAQSRAVPVVGHSRKLKRAAPSEPFLGLLGHPSLRQMKEPSRFRANGP